MLWYVCLIVSVLALLVVAKLALDKRLGRTRMLYVMVGCAVVAYVLYIPPLMTSYNPIAAILGGLINVLQVISLDADYLQFHDLIFTVIKPTFVADVYYSFLALIHMLLPAVSAMTAVTLVVQCLTEIQIKSIKKRKISLHVFSQLNYEAIMLARDIRAHDKKCDILFLDSADDSDYSDLQQELRCSVLNEKIDQLKAHAKTRQVYYYCISQNREENLNSALAIVNYLQASDMAVQQNNHVYLFTTDPAAELIADSIHKGHVNLSIVDRNRTAAYQLLMDYPLTQYAADGKLHVLICGFDSVAKTLLRAVSWVGQLHGYSLKITVLAKNLEQEAQNFKADYPNLFTSRYNIAFVNYENELQFRQLLRQHAPDANYLIVAEEVSEVAIDKALKLRRFYYREDPEYRNAPALFVYMENADKAQAVAALKTAETKDARRMSYSLIPFGTASSIFSFEQITDSDLECLSKNVHLVYEDIFSDGPIDVAGALERYNLFEVNKSSNRANALHIRYKLQMLGLDISEDPQAEEVALEDYLTPEMLQRLTVAEHDRWMAFLDSEGWEEATVAQSKAYQASGISKGRHNCPLLKLHPYICPFEDLPQRSEELGLPDSTVYDRELIHRIPDILHDKWNVLGKKYKIVKFDSNTGGIQ